MSIANFDRRELAKNTLSAISQVCIGRKFVGRDGTEFSIHSENENADMKCFIDVTAKMQGVDRAVARYALVLIGVSEE